MIYCWHETTQNRPGQALPLLRAADAQATIPIGKTGGPGAVSQAGVLQSPVHGKGDGARGGQTCRVEAAGGEVQGRYLRELRGSRRPPHPPHGQEPGQQRQGEFADMVRLLPPEVALGARAAASKAIPADVLRLWEAGPQAWPVSEALPAVPQVRQPAIDQEEHRRHACDCGRIAAAASGGSTSLSNLPVVPQCVAAAFVALSAALADPSNETL